MDNLYVLVKWSAKTRKYYESLGYLFTSYGDSFYVPISQTAKGFKIEFKCPNCGSIFKTTKKNFINMRYDILCPQCSKENKIKDYYNKTIEFCKSHNHILISEIEEFENRNSVIKYKCLSHGIQEVKLNSILENKNCYHCSRKVALEKKHNATLNERQHALYRNAVLVAKKKGYEIISSESDIINNTSYIVYKCDHGHTQTMRINNFINERNCPECNKEKQSLKFRLGIDEVVEKITNCNGVIINPDEYVNNNTKNLKIVCNSCGKIFETSLSRFLCHNGQNCPDCSTRESVGETRVRKFLENEGILFEQEKRFKDCKDKNTLPFDFFLPDYNAIIEFDGIQHYQEAFEFRDSLEQVKYHDGLKNKYCKEHNINLLRIPYWEMNNTEKTIKNFLLNIKI